jgi:tRNA(Ile)-lysidine synthase
VKREDIETYCDENSLMPKTDITNLKPVYHRNKIRLELIPYLKENYNPNLLESLVRTSKILKADSDYLDSQAYDIFKLISTLDSNEKISIPISSIEILHMAMKTRLFRLATEKLVGKREVFSYTQMQSILALVSKKITGKRLQLPMGITALINYDKLIFTTSSEIDYDYSYKLEVDEFVKVNELGATFTAKILNMAEMKKINVANNKKMFDFDKVKKDLIIRNRNVGDVFRPLGMKGKKKLKDFFIDNKVERSERSKTALICDGGKIMWVVGHRISDYYKVTKQTTTFLLIEYHEDNKNVL